MRLQKGNHRVAPVSKDGRPGPTVRDAAHEGCGIWVGLRSRLHEAGRNPERGSPWLTGLDCRRTDCARACSDRLTVCHPEA
jgi:hypothetical protein